MAVKIGYVGSMHGELSVMVTPREVITSVDLSLPNVSAFVLRVPISEVDNQLEAFQEMMGAVLQQTIEYLKACKIPETLVTALHQNIQTAMEEVTDDDKADRAGSGGSGLLEQIIDLEPLDVFEAEFDIPDGLIAALHKHVVTAGQGDRPKSTLSALHQASLASWKAIIKEEVDHGTRKEGSQTSGSPTRGAGDHHKECRGICRVGAIPPTRNEANTGRPSQGAQGLGERVFVGKLRDLLLAYKSKRFTHFRYSSPGVVIAREGQGGWEVVALEFVRMTPDGPAWGLSSGMQVEQDPPQGVQLIVGAFRIKASLFTLKAIIKEEVDHDRTRKEGSETSGDSSRGDDCGRMHGVVGGCGSGKANLDRRSHRHCTAGVGGYSSDKPCAISVLRLALGGKGFTDIIDGPVGGYWAYSRKFNVWCVAIPQGFVRPLPNQTVLWLRFSVHSPVHPNKIQIQPGWMKLAKKATLFTLKADVKMHTTPPVGTPREDQRTHLDEDLKEELDPTTEDPDLIQHTTGVDPVRVGARSTLAAFKSIQRTPTPHPPIVRPPKPITQARPSLRDLIRKFKTNQNKRLTGPIYVLVYDVNGRPVGVRSIKGPGWQGISGKVASMGMAGWLLPDGSYLDVRSSDDSNMIHEAAARRYLREHGVDLSGSDVDASDYAIAHGWIRLWETPHGYATVEMGPMTQPALVRLQKFFNEHPVWIKSGDTMIFAGTKNWTLPFSEFMACNTVSDLGRSIVTASLDAWKDLTFRTKLAKSFDQVDIPNNFWAVLNLGYELDPKVVQQLVSGKLDNIRGISDSGAIVAQFTFHSGNAILRMPGRETVQLNRLSRVNYDNPNYLCSKGLSALFRVFNQDKDDNGAGNVIVNIMNRFKGIDENLAYYSTAASNSIKYAPSIVSEVARMNSPRDLAIFLVKGINQFFAAKFGEDPPVYTLAQLLPWVLEALKGVGRVFSDEGEWLIKDGVLQIPQGSTLVVDFPEDAQRLLELEQQGQDPKVTMWSHYNIEGKLKQAHAVLDAVEQIKAAGIIKVVLKNWAQQVTERKSDILEKKRKRRSATLFQHQES